MVSNLFQESSCDIWVGIDVGLRKTFNFSNGLNFYLTREDYDKKNEYLEKKLDMFMKKNFDSEKYKFFMESFLLDRLMEMPNKKKFSKKYETKNNHLVQYFIKKFEGRISFVESANSSKECSNCGFICHENIANLCGFGKSKKIKCIFCLSEMDRDINAAKVILQRGLKNGREEKQNI